MCQNFISNSEFLSKEEVDSSKSNILGFFKKVLAIHNLCFSPPDIKSFLFASFDYYF